MSKRILIVEDDQNLSKLMKEQLEGAGYAVDIALTGQAGINALEKKPDLILLDIMLPQVSGLEIMKQVRSKDEWGKGVPIVIISNLTPDSAEIIDSVAAYEPVYYIVKADFSLGDLVEKVNDILNPQPA